MLAIMPVQQRPGHVPTPEEHAAVLAALPMMLVVMIPFGLLNLLICTPVTHAATVWAVGHEYLGQPVTLGGAIRAAFGRLLALLGTNLLVGVIIFGVYMGCLLPGIVAMALAPILGILLVVVGAIACIVLVLYLWFRFWFTNEAVVIEGVSGVEALQRSGVLMRGNMGTAFVLSLVLGIIAVLAHISAAFLPVPALSVVAQVVIGAVVVILYAAASVVFYFSCRCKNENFDLTLLASAIGKDELPPAPPGS
jgi:hypothetical protein